MNLPKPNSTYIKSQQPNKNLVQDDKHNPQAMMLPLNWHNQNSNITTAEKLKVLL